MNNTPTITAAVITRNEAGNIRACLETLQWADEMLIMDSCSTDDTVAIAREMGAVVHARPFDDFPTHRNAALDAVRTDWVLFVDADERVTPELAREVRKVVNEAEAKWREGATAEAGAVAGYWIPRRNFIMGRWIRHGGWYPDYQLRLLKIGHARYDEAVKVHEVVNLDGASGHLREPFIHYNYERLSQLFSKQASYAKLEAASLHRRGIRARPHNFILQPLREFRRRFFSLGGYHDGLHGLFLALLLAAYTFVTYVHLWRMPPPRPTRPGKENSGKQNAPESTTGAGKR